MKVCTDVYVWRTVHRIQGVIYSQLDFVGWRILVPDVRYSLDETLKFTAPTMARLEVLGTVA